MKRSIILQEREKTHGSFQRNSEIWSHLTKCGKLEEYMRLPVAQQLALSMIFLKVSRIISGQFNEKDHWNDIVGYAQLGVEACAE